MNTVNIKGFRHVVIAAVLAVGIVTTIATGGGGSGGGSDGGDTGNGGSDGITPPTLDITAENGSDVAEAVVTAVGLSFDIGDITDENLATQPGDIGLLAKATTGFHKSLPGGNQQAPENCANGGSVDVSITQANINTISVGDRIVATFVDCDDGLGYVISGTVDIRFADVQGDILTDVFLLGMDIVMTGVVITEGTSTATGEGDFALTLDSLDFPVMRMSLSGDELQLGSNGEVFTLSDFDHFLQVDIGPPEALVANVLGRLASSTLGGSVDYDTPVTIEAIDNGDPYVGEILVTGADDSTVRIVIVDDGNIRLEIDEDGDGIADEFIDTNWDELNGRETPVTGSAINSENAPILAREVYNAVSGFGSLTTAAGRQLLPNTPFAQLNAMQVSGEFGPLDVGCEVSGTASVSGTKSDPMTFSPGDDLNVIYDACDGNAETMLGMMTFSVGSYDAPSESTYAVSGSVVESSLQRVFGATCFTGTGTFDMDFDFYTTAGVHSRASSTTDFTVSAGGRSQRLTGASVNAEIFYLPVPIMVTRESSGVMTGTDLTGSFRYQSVSPDEFFADEDPATGPYAGELLITAADDSSMRMVAIDEFNLRLDLDYNGDSVIDQSIPTTWATLGYDDMICPQNEL
jgi:hypothetical protein